MTGSSFALRADTVFLGVTMSVRLVVRIGFFLFLLSLAIRFGLAGALFPGVVVGLGLYGDTFEAWVGLALAGSLAALAVGLYASRARRSTQSPVSATDAEGDEDEPSSPAEVGVRWVPAAADVAAIIGLVAAVAGLLAGVSPSTPYAAAEPACRGAFLQGSDFYAQTTAGGVTVREGPGQGYAQTRRFSAGCTVGFTGYCVGQPVPSPLTGVADSRWLIVNGSGGLVSSSVMTVESQVGDSLPPRNPAPECDELGGLDQPETTSLRGERGRDENSSQFVRLLATSEAPLVGFAFQVLDPAKETYDYTAIKGPKTSSSDTFRRRWESESASKLLEERSGVIRVLATACLSASFPVGQASAIDVTFANGRVTDLAVVDEDEDEGDSGVILKESACLVG